MIKLTINPDSHPIVKIFQKNTVIIGSAHADLVLAEEMLQETHVRISHDSIRYMIFNVANDPYVTLNGLPFGKKALKNNDIFQIGSTLIRFEEYSQRTIQNPVDTETKLPEILEKSIHTGPDDGETKLTPYTEPFLDKDMYEEPENFEKQFNEELERLNQFPINQDIFEEGLASYENVDALMKRVEQLEKENSTHPLMHFKKKNLSNEKKLDDQNLHPLAEEFSTLRIDTPTTPSEEITTSPKFSLKDYYLKDEDESENLEPGKNPHIESDPLSPKKWKLIFNLFLALILAGVISIGLLYLWVSDQSGEEEIKAAKGVADIAMALTYAQVKHITPQNQNWSDPEFIKNNLTAVLASVYPSFACFDTHGQFNDCPYISRIYTNSDSSKFLVIAQPAPSVFQWIIPKASIIVDSNVMEMRKITDLRSLNRLLVNANTLDGVNAVEISQLIKQGELIPLSHLASSKDENEGYNLPKALAYIHPGAQNLIYNAPRYYQLGQNLLQRTLSLNENVNNPNEIALLQEEIVALTHLTDMVLYSADGMQRAIQAQKALMTLVPTEKFIVAYLQFNSEGKVINSRLVIDETSNEIANASDMKPHEHSADSSQNQAEIDLAEKAEILVENSNKNHPLYEKLASLKYARQQALTPITDQMIALLTSHSHEVLPLFIDTLKSLLAQYQKINEEQEKKIIQHLSEIYYENSDIPLTQFINLVKESGLEAILQDFLKTLKHNVKSDAFSKKDFEQQLKKIEEAKNWPDLQQQTNEITEFFTLERFPNPESLITHQNKARLQILQKLNEFLLMPNSPLQKEDFNAETRSTLSEILKTLWIYDHEVYDFYLKEFDLQG